MSARAIRGRLAAEVRHHPDKDHTELRREYYAQALAEHVSRVVAAAPPLTAEQRARITAALAGGGRGA
ncbi:hypothetical protein ATL40_0760 [Serinibacter salmoneus]|uniref:PhiRv1 phage protein n=1 Tax=Serinibacter salmoneus TaxID=556530 RepID=A0A2A9CXS0_9MICO|nr:hypothetical protein ATL40_0760 [Serinibacter salmoneus]